MMLNPRAVVRALGGVVSVRNVLAPGSGHSRADRSLSIKIEPTDLRLVLDILKRESAQPAKPGASKISTADVDASA
jgi:hypothetical protein